MRRTLWTFAARLVQATVEWGPHGGGGGGNSVEGPGAAFCRPLAEGT